MRRVGLVRLSARGGIRRSLAQAQALHLDRDQRPRRRLYHHRALEAVVRAVATDTDRKAQAQAQVIDVMVLRRAVLVLV